MGDAMGETVVERDQTVNEATPKQPMVQNSINETFFASAEVKMHKLPEIEFIPVNKEATDRIQNAATKAVQELSRKGSNKDVWLGFAGGFAGGVIGGFLDFIEMVKQIRDDGFTLKGCLPILWFVFAIITSLRYWVIAKKETASLDKVSVYLGQIDNEIAGIYEKSGVQKKSSTKPNVLDVDTVAEQEENYLSKDESNDNSQRFGG